jgi:phosphatidylserine/phosphatidylglycerophosphate/cardiolipin synthase-like enzyme
MRVDKAFRINFCCLFGAVLFIFCSSSSFLSATSWVYFSPKDKVGNHLIRHINESKKRIYAAIYNFTDKDVAQALIDAKKNKGIDIQVVTDQSCLQSEHGKIELLKENGIEVFVFKPRQGRQLRSSGKNFNEIMHNKFALFDNKVWTGSYNWTISAKRKNRENVLCNDEKDVCKQYEKEFESLKRKCVKRGGSLKKASRGDDKNLKGKVFELLKNIKTKFVSE